MPAIFAVNQVAFRFYNDDGSESANTAIDAENTNINFLIKNGGDGFLVMRIGVKEESTGNTGAVDWQLQYSRNGGAYTNVTTSSSYVKAYDSPNLTNQGATTDRLTTPLGTFIAGLVCEDGVPNSFNLTLGNNTEFLFPLTMIFNDLSDGDTLDFRMLCAGSSFSLYDSTGRITITKISSGRKLVGLAGNLIF